MNERIYLDEQGEYARNAMTRALADAKADAMKVLDPRIWAKGHPWKTVGTFVIAGFLAGDAAMRAARREAPFPRRPSEKKENLEGDADEPGDREPTSRGKIRTLIGLFKKVRKVVSIVEPFLMEMWMANREVNRRHGGNGHAHAPPPPEPSEPMPGGPGWTPSGPGNIPGGPGTPL